jgi:Holliday junction resolvase
MRYHAKKDSNHRSIVKALERSGFSVLDLSCIGGDKPDILVASGNRSVVVEIKNPETCGKLSSGQSKFFTLWRGEKLVAYSVEDIFKFFGMVK